MTTEHVLIVISVPPESADFASDILWSAGAQAVEERNAGQVIQLLTDLGERPIDRWRAIVAEHPTASDWDVATTCVAASVADTWREHAHTTTVSNVSIVPAWQAVVPGPSDVLIDPGGAFGMGDHPTTRATLQLALGAEGTNALDLGCGSGVLAIALAKFRGMRCVAVDTAPAAIEATERNVTLNGVAGLLVVSHGDVRSVRGTYDIVLANILAPVLLSDAADIALRVTAGGTLVLSGFTSTRLADIQATYEALGLIRTDLVEIDGWLALQMKRVEES